MADMSIVLGKFRGADIELHWTFVLLMLFVLVFDVQAFFLLALFFICVLLHEMVHADVASRKKVGLKRIVIYPLGGGTVIDQESMDPGTEVAVSISGPIATLLLAAALYIASIITGGALASMLYLLALLNFLLGVFNLLPWMPLDGGRALRGWLEKTRSHTEATRLTLAASRITMAAYVVLSSAYILFANYSASYKGFLLLFNALIALFIYGGTESEMLLAKIKERTGGIGIARAVSSDYTLLKSGTPMRALRALVGNPYSHTVITKSSGGYAVLSNKRLRREALKTSISDVSIGSLCVPIPSLDYRTSMFTAFQTLESGEAPIAAVVKNGKLIGIARRQRLEYLAMLRMRFGKPNRVGRSAAPHNNA